MSIISTGAQIGKHVTIKENVTIEDHVTIGDHCYIDYGTIIKENTVIGDNSFVGSNSILGEFLSDFFPDHSNRNHPLIIGKNALIRSNAVLYGDSQIGDYFQCGHHVTIREYARIGAHVSVGTLSDIQGDCVIGDYSRLHSNVHIGMRSVIGNFVWIFPYVVLTNDPTPPSDQLKGVVVKDFACICTQSVVLPGVQIGEDALIGAGANVTKNIPAGMVAVGNPAKVVKAVAELRDHEGKEHYPWRYYFDRGMPWANMGYDTWVEKEKQ